MHRVREKAIETSRTEPLLPFGTRPFTDHEISLSRLESQLHSDPFLPEQIRRWLVTFVQNSKVAHVKAYDDAFKKCGFGIADLSISTPSAN